MKYNVIFIKIISIRNTINHLVELGKVLVYANGKSSGTGELNPKSGLNDDLWLSYSG